MGRALPSLWLSLVLLAGARATAQSSETPALAAAAPEARAAWERLCTASGSAERASISAFRLSARVRRREGVQRNDLSIEYSYLAPDCIRFMLPSRNETGRFGPDPSQYWLRQEKEVVVLAGREYKEDRAQVDDMCALARNYVALSNPARLQLLALELTQPPRDLGQDLAKRARKLSWLALESPDFALVRREGPPASPGTRYRVELGLAQDHLPSLVVIRELAPPEGGSPAAAAGEPLLVEFGAFRQVNGYQVPFVLNVHTLDRSQAPPAFTADPAQEIYIGNAELQPPLTVEDFKPVPPRH
jgi:hypothetical protein